MFVMYLSNGFFPFLSFSGIMIHIHEITVHKLQLTYFITFLYDPFDDVYYDSID